MPTVWPWAPWALGGVAELDVVGHVGRRQDDVAVPVQVAHRQGPVVMGGDDHEAVPVPYPFTVGQAQSAVVLTGDNDVAHAPD